MTRDELTALRDGIAQAEGERLLATLRDSSGLSVAALAEAAHVGRSTAEERLRQLAARGAIGKNPEGRWEVEGRRAGPSAPVVALTADHEDSGRSSPHRFPPRWNFAEAERLEKPVYRYPPWIRPIADYNRRETTIAEGRIYG